MAGTNEINSSTEANLLSSHSKELSKQYVIFDGQNRVSKVYSAVRKAQDGDACIVTEYIYRDPTTTQMLARKEAPGVWSAAYDADFTI
jgi:hypothetical protein